MKLSALICFFLLALAANSQTKEAEFKKAENLLKKSNGLASTDFKIVDFLFGEKSVRIDLTAEGKNGTIAYTNLDWNGFDYSIKKWEGSDRISQLVISFEKKIDVTSYENKKQIDKDEDDEMLLFINKADEKLIQQQLEELQTYTWKTLNELRTADRAMLMSFITKTLNTAIEEEDAKIKSITECEISFAFDSGKEIIIPTKKLKLHSKEFISDDYLICYGKQTAVIKTKENSITQARSMEHPDMELSFEDREDKVIAVEYAIKRLAASCKS